MKHKLILTIAFLICVTNSGMKVYGQEALAPVRFNPSLYYHNHTDAGRFNNNTNKKTSSINLPFFEDFAYSGIYPDTTKWMDNEAYINNTMPVSPPSRGVATLDNLNSLGLPYDTLSNTDFRYADSLTSQPINMDLTTVTPADSVYFSFFYQAQGNGYYPLPQDSLILYFKNIYGTFIKVWSIPGPDSTLVLQPFQQVMVPIADSLFFSGSFQFRFVNIAAAYWADADWNIDYMRLDKNRSIGDTAIADVAFTSNPTSLLNDYTSMPYSHFMANTAGELATNVYDSIAMDIALSQNITDTMIVTDAASGVILNPAYPYSFGTLPAYSILGISEPLNIPTFPSYPPRATVVFNTTYYLQGAQTGPKNNDTITHQQVFDNYLAYDDGSAERAYFLNMNSSGAITAELEIEFHLNHPDTLRGLAIYFARQIPLADYKIFFIKFYSSLIGVNGSYTDHLIHEQDYLSPGYVDTVNHFWIYKLDTPQVLPAGTFYAGTMQPAYSPSDSLYFGFDVNRVGGNHAYFRVEGAGQPWNPSLFNGAIMIRPLVGHDITASSVTQVAIPQNEWHVAPQPACKELSLYFEGDGPGEYIIYDMLGRERLAGSIFSSKSIDVSSLGGGNYIISLIASGKSYSPIKFVKL